MTSLHYPAGVGVGVRPLPEADPDGTPPEPLELMLRGPDPASFTPPPFVLAPPSPRAGPLPSRWLSPATGAGTASPICGPPPAAPDYGYGPRYGTNIPKGLGYFGPLQLPNGGVMGEFSVGVSINGKQTEIPSIVPTLTKDELAQLESIATKVVPMEGDAS